MIQRTALALLLSLSGSASAQPIVQQSAGERMLIGADSLLLGARLRVEIRRTVADQLRDPSSLQDFAIIRVNARMAGDSLAPGYACGVYNARNGYGGYAGRAYFVVRLMGPRTSPRTALPEPILTSEDNTVHREACFDFPTHTAPWVANVSSKEVFRNGCLASRRITEDNRKVFWILSDAFKEGFVRAKAPGC